MITNGSSNEQLQYTLGSNDEVKKVVQSFLFTKPPPSLSTSLFRADKDSLSEAPLCCLLRDYSREIPYTAHGCV